MTSSINLLTILCVIALNNSLLMSQSPTNVEEAVKVECPRLEMTYPDPFDEKAPLKFQVKFVGDVPTKRLKFSWFVSKGFVKSGQGTPTIVVEAKGADRQGLTATVIVCGLPFECQNEVSRTTPIAKSY